MPRIPAGMGHVLSDEGGGVGVESGVGAGAGVGSTGSTDPPEHHTPLQFAQFEALL